MMMETPVLIVGGGPVGLTLALDLAWRGLSSIVVELRGPGEPPSPKCNHIAARTLETFRRLGFVDKIRDAGLPHDWPHDVRFVTSFTRWEIGRLPIPSRAERFTDTIAPDSHWPTPDPPHRINQIYLEPLLHAEAAANPLIRLLNRHRVDSISQDGQGVRAQVVSLEGGQPFEISSRYLAGCDGGRSGIRKQIGASLSGNPDVGPGRTSAFIQAPGLAAMGGEPAWSSHSVNARQSGSVTAIDGGDLWLIRWPIKDGETDTDPATRDYKIRNILGVGPTFHFDILHEDFWKDSRLTCDRIQKDRVFLAGDAAHLWPATGGYGMNAGLADAVDLAWMLAAVLKGWAPEALLDAYQPERLPVTDQVSRFVKGHSEESRSRRGALPAEIEDDTAAGEAARAAYGQGLVDLNARQYYVAGLNFGYFYDDSPIIAYDGESAPPYSMHEFTTSTVPGCRAPHLWLADGSSLYDQLGPDFTLVRLDPDAAVDRLAAAAAKVGMPLKSLDIPAAEAGNAYHHALTLIRPDGHVAWRGDAQPDDAEALVDLVRGVPCAFRPREAVQSGVDHVRAR